jgi:hypothetical protein
VRREKRTRRREASGQCAESDEWSGACDARIGRTTNLLGFASFNSMKNNLKRGTTVDVTGEAHVRRYTFRVAKNVNHVEDEREERTPTPPLYDLVVRFTPYGR